jgi:Xaa-Pro aminopeptidase
VIDFDYAERTRRLQELMRRNSIDVALLSVGADLPCFTGYEAMATERITVLVVRKRGTPVLFIPELEAPRVTSGEFDVMGWSETEDPVALATAVGGSPSSVVVGDHMWSTFLVGFQKEWPHPHGLWLLV